MKKSLIVLALIFVFLTCTAEGCTSQETSTANAVDRQQAWYLKYQNVPFFTWSLERAVITQIYSARNEARSTFTYSFSDLGNILFNCPTKGFPLPYGVQLTNSERVAYNSSGAVIPQAEPNGLYSTGISTTSTWYLCVRQSGELAPVYSEPAVMAFPFPVIEKDGRLYDISDQPSSINIDITRPAEIPLEPPSLP